MQPVCTSASTTLPGPRTGWISTRAQIVLATCACTGASAFLFATDPNHHAFYPQCLLYKMTGFYCAGCGITRGLYALLHGRMLEALHDNALFIGALPLLIYVVGAHVLSAWRMNAWPKIHAENRNLTRRGLGILVLVIGFMTLRNLPGWPFEYLKPLAG